MSEKSNAGIKTSNGEVFGGGIFNILRFSYLKVHDKR